MQQLIQLLARSRVVELDITATMFGGLIPSSQLDQLRKDVKDLANSLKHLYFLLLPSPLSRTVRLALMGKYASINQLRNHLICCGDFS